MSTINFLTTLPARENLDHTKDNEVFALFSFNPPAMDTSKRPPLDIAVAMDVSGSMSGGKLDNAKRSLLKLVEHLTDKDRLAVVSFDSNIHTVCAPKPMNAANKKEAIKGIKGMYAGSMTNLSGGLLLALTFLKEQDQREGAIRRCMVFTDGQANVGISDSDQLADAVLEFRSGIGISTFGYGQDHDADLLTKLAQDGDFYYIDTPDKILSAFGAELGGLVSTYAQNVKLILDPVEGVEIAEVLNDLTVKDEEGKVTIECDDLLAEQEYHIAVRIKIDKRAKNGPRAITLVRAHTTYFDVGAKGTVDTKVTLKVKFVKPSKEDTEDNKIVMEEVAIQKINAAQAQAMGFADAGDFAGAQQVLVASAAYAESVGTAKAGAFAAMSRGLAVENYAGALQYGAGGRSEAMGYRKVVTRRRAGPSGMKGGVDVNAFVGNDLQREMVANFEDKDDADPAADEALLQHALAEEVKAKADVESSEGLSKSRSNRW